MKKPNMSKLPQTQKLIESLLEGDEENQIETLNSITEEERKQLEAFLELHPHVGETIEREGGVPFSDDDELFFAKMDTTHEGHRVFEELLEMVG